jgi:iron complex outermembrane recepter protein
MLFVMAIRQFHLDRSFPRLSQINVFFVAMRTLAILLPAAHVHGASLLDEVVVTASQREQASIDAPAAIQTVKRDVIEQAGPQANLSESLSRIPGITILNRQNYAQDLQLSIRGFGARTAFGIRGVRILVDGIPATMPDGQGQASTINLASTGRIEVLRGPFAQLYGNAAGGVVQTFTREAPDSPELLLRRGHGSFGLAQTGIQFAAKAHSLGLVADYSELETSGFRANSASQRRHVNGKLTWASGATTLAIVANLFDMPKAFDPGGLGENWEQDPSAARPFFITNRARKTVQQNQVGLSGSHRFHNDLELDTRAYFGTRDVFQAQSGASWIGLDREYQGLSAGLARSHRTGALPWRWSFGIDWDEAKDHRTGGATGTNGALPGDKSPESLTRNQNYRTYNQDFYGQLQAYPTPALSLIAGLRSSAVTMAVADRLFPEASGNVTHRALSPVAGLTWHVTHAVNIYANTGNGFETPSVAETSYTGIERLDRFNSSLKPSKSRHRELGIKAAIGMATGLDIAVFDIDTRDDIVVLASEGGKTSYTNAAKTNRKGAELLLESVVQDHWRLTAAVTLLHAQYSEPFQSGDEQVAAGSLLPGIPQGYRFAELAWSSIPWRNRGNTSVRVSGTVAALEIMSAGRIYVNDQNTRATRGYDIANLRLSTQLPAGPGTVSILGRIENVLDKRYVGSVIVGNANPYEPAPGRNWFFGLQFALTL